MQAKYAKYIYFRLSKDYAGHKKDEVIKIVGKLPTHLKKNGEEVTEDEYKAFMEDTDAQSPQTRGNVASGITEHNAPDLTRRPDTGQVVAKTTEEGTMVPGGDEGTVESQVKGNRASEKETTKARKR